MHTNSESSSPAPDEGFRITWLIGLGAAVGMVVSSFIPWFGEPGTLVNGSGEFHIGVYMSMGRYAALAAGLAVSGWLFCKRVGAGLFSLLSLGLGWQTYHQIAALHPNESSLMWGFYLFAAFGLVSLGSALAVGGRAGTGDGRDLIRSFLNRHLNPGDGDPKGVDTFIITLIAVNVISVMVQTEEAINAEYETFFLINETFSTFIFSVEYVLRVWISNLNERFKGVFKGRLRYAITPMSMVDFIAIIPFFLQFIQMDLRIARAIRLMRLLRILKMGRYAHAVSTLYQVIDRKKEEMAITMFVSVMILILSASAMFFCEHEAGKFTDPKQFTSIPDTMWWAVVTLTSVGYGDVSPITGIGKVVGAIVCMIGVLVVALPTGILASGFMEVMREQRRGKDSDIFGFCPHCGEQLMPGEDLGT